ncbi:MAG: aspartate kinase, partial [Calditrichaeota bacterium]|nr:aspartate kinase [Calditrichota bacterium]
MPVIIQKFGGSLLETPDHIKRAAAYIIRTKTTGDDPVVVVSAPGSTTDRFFELARQVTDEPDEREMDMLLSVGERTAMALLAMAINSDGRYNAVSFTGSQVGIITDTKHTDARIIEVKCLRIREALEQGQIPIVAGFQG